ncbi:MAG: helix-turn-helix transcriptional regulator [Nocardiopsaceae bacterium]|nr:helix-turn-helix transcriptional regulator [Nocardiopsaceae bacterium]
MVKTPSSSVQRARRESAARLREIRLDAGLTARALSAEAGWHESKASRIESAKQAPTDADIHMWCRVCGAADQDADLIAASRIADSMYVEWRRQNRTGLRRTQEARVPLFEQTRLMRVYCSTVIPGLFQTSTYAAALLSSITAFRGTPDDVEQAVAARMARNRVLHEGDHRFGVLVEESVLRYQVADAATMVGQLEHLLSVMSLPSVALGVIPFSAEHRPIWTLETFTLFDQARIHVETLSAQITVTAPSELILYIRAFEQLAQMAVTGAQARRLITSAIEDLEHPRKSPQVR